MGSLLDAQSGFVADECFVAATGNAAHALGRESWLGALEAGKVADLIVHEKNPLEDLSVLADKRSLQFVMQAGMIAAAHVGNEWPKELIAKHVLNV